MTPISAERLAGAAFLAIVVGLFAGVAASIVMPSLAVMAMTAFACALVLARPIARRLPADFDGCFSARRGLSALWAVVALLALVRLAGLAVFAADANHPEASPMWFDPFYVRHSCFSAAWKAATVLPSNPANLYDVDAFYDGHVGRFELDAFQYPPQFLLLSQLLAATGGSFLQQRAAWFVIQGAVFLGAVLAVSGWIGGAAGRRIAAWSPALWLSTPVLVTLQVGNYQIGALALAMLAMVLFDRGRFAAGGALLGFSLVKIFPGVLCAYLLFARRWKALGWTLAFLAAYSALAWLTVGPKPYHAFFVDMLPQMASGELWWSWLDDPGSAYVNAMNDSIPAQLLKLKQSGLVPGLDHRALAAASSLWSIVVLACAWIAARRAPRDERWRQAACWIALLGVAALRNPFLPDHNGLIAGAWLWLIVAAAGAGASDLRARVAGFAALWPAVGVVMPFAWFTHHKLLVPLQLLGTASLALMVGLMLWSLLRRADGLSQPNALAMAH